MIASAISGSATSSPRATTTALSVTPEAHECVDAGVVSVGHESRAVEPPARARPDHRGHEVAAEPDHSREGEREQLLGRLWIHEPLERLVAGDARADEDRENHAEPCVSLRAFGAERECDSEGDCRGGVAEVVNEVGEEGDAVADEEDSNLRESGRCEHAEGERDGAKTLP